MGCSYCGCETTHSAWCALNPNGKKALVPGEWVAEAACRGRDMSPRTTRSILSAKSVCMACPVKRDCLEFACSTHEPEEIWGAATPGERRVLGSRPTPERINAHFRKVAKRLGLEGVS
jgi:WhiB family transcriptional regulator, redox-sensing transcriptional regulator